MREEEFSSAVARAGGEAFAVGGWVRDLVRGEEPHDKDYVITGVAEEKFEAIFPSALRAGRRFPVYRVKIDGIFRDVAFARRETKTGAGYRGFDVTFGESTTIIDDLERRDTTMNSMAIPLSGGGLIDPFGGAGDIKRRVIRATSEHFKDDPVRALRAARQSAQFGYAIEPATSALMSECRGELSGEPGERIARELSLALKTDRPSVFFRALLGAGLLDVTFPQIFALAGAVQSEEHHPEGDAFEHTMAAVDAASAMTRRPEVRFAVLAHDIGKGLVPPEERPHYYGHERLGLDALSEWSAKMPLPKLWLSCAEFAIREHMRARGLSKPGKIADFLARLRRHPIGADGMAAVMMADARRAPEILNRAEEFYRAMDEVTGRDIPESLAGAERGEWLRRRWAEAVARVM